MKTASSTISAKALVDGTWNGLNQDHEGAIDVADARPGADTHQRHHRQRDQHDRLDGEQPVLHPRGQLDADAADPRHRTIQRIPATVVATAPLSPSASSRTWAVGIQGDIAGS